MYNKIFSTALILMLFLTGCIPSKSMTVRTDEIIQPVIAATLTGIPGSTGISAPGNAAKQTGTPVTASNVVPTNVATPELDKLDLQAQSAILFDATNGKVLYTKNANQKIYPASTTKILTAAIALDFFQTDEIIVVGEEVNLAWTSERVEVQKAGLYYGQELAMKELLYALLLESGSDAAFTIAVNVAKRESDNDFLSSEEAITNFYALMNQKAMSIGALETNFTNPDGMQDASHYSTAYDIALIAEYAMRDARFREIVATQVYTTAQTFTSVDGIKYSRTWVNTNRLIQPQDEHYYAIANGIKTGTTLEAGHCLVSSAMVRDHLVIAVVLNSTEEGVWSDSVTLLEYSKENPQ